MRGKVVRRSAGKQRAGEGNEAWRRGALGAAGGAGGEPCGPAAVRARLLPHGAGASPTPAHAQPA